MLRLQTRCELLDETDSLALDEEGEKVFDDSLLVFISATNVSMADSFSFFITIK